MDRRKKVAVFFANGLGDHILALPSMRALRTVLSARLTLVTAKGMARRLFDDVEFDEVVEVEMWRESADAGRSFRVEDVVERIGHVDSLISLVPWDSESLQSLRDRIKPAWSLGLGAGYEYAVRTDARHSADRLFEVVRAIRGDLRLDNFTYPAPLPTWSENGAVAVYRAIGANRSVLVLHEETATPEKRWAPEAIEEFLEGLIRVRPDLYVLVPSRGEPSFDLGVAQGRITSIPGVSLAFFLSLVRRADIFVGVDSLGIHAADLWRVPGVGLFGPTNPAEWGFRFEEGGMHVYGNGDMASIPVPTVLEATQRVLNAPRSRGGE